MKKSFYENPEIKVKDLRQRSSLCETSIRLYSNWDESMDPGVDDEILDGSGEEYQGEW